MRRYLTRQHRKGLAPGLDKDIGIARLLDGRESDEDDFGPSELVNTVSHSIIMRGQIMGGVKKMTSYLGSGGELAHKRSGTLLKRVEDKSQRTGAVAQIQQLLQQKQTVRALVGLRRRCHDGTTENRLLLVFLGDFSMLRRFPGPGFAKKDRQCDLLTREGKLHWEEVR